MMYADMQISFLNFCIITHPQKTIYVIFYELSIGQTIDTCKMLGSKYTLL